MKEAVSFNSGCLLCGADLVYFKQPRLVTCALCGNALSSQAACAEGHFVCDRCHGLPALDLIEWICRASSEADPVRLAESLMRNQAVKMHGPEHHFLFPAVLVTAWYTVHGDDGKAEKLVIARKRAEDVKQGVYLTCGKVRNLMYNPPIPSTG